MRRIRAKYPNLNQDENPVVEAAALHKIWKAVRSRERKVRLTDIPLVRDSTGGIAFELGLDDVVSNLQRRLSDGTYRPQLPVIIESAKSQLLHRRLSFLAFEDVLILGTLVHTARPKLMANMVEWVSFGRSDPTNPTSTTEDDDAFGYVDWWNEWLKFRNLVRVIQDDPRPYLVTSDITNFFESIDLSLLRSKISSEGALNENSINLLFHLLDRIRIVEEYRPTVSLGLPAVADDTSRILAHFYLAELDGELSVEGQNGRYTRWVDDMVISTEDAIEGRTIVARIERTLSKLGLVANSAKTKLISKEQFRIDHYEEQNAYLDLVHDTTETENSIPLHFVEGFEYSLNHFLTPPYVGEWEQVLRRFYTQSKRIRSETLLAKWCEHLAEFPGSSAKILDYVSFFPGNMDFCDRFFSFLKRRGPLFDDIQILLYETLLLKPFPVDPEMRCHIFNLVNTHFSGNDGFEAPGGYVKGLQALAMYKFGGAKASDCVAETFAEIALESPVFATYGLPVLAASETHRAHAFGSTEQLEDSRILRVRTLIERLEGGDENAIGLLLGLLEPKTTKYPTRLIINTRALPLLKIARRSVDENARERVDQAARIQCTKLNEAMDSGLVDGFTLEHLNSD